MTPRIAAFLKKSGAVPGISAETEIDAIKMNTTTFQGGSLVSLLFLDGSGTPAYVLRIPRDRARPDRVLANYRALEHLRAIESVAGTVPLPIFRGELSGTVITVESCMHGTSLFAELSGERGIDQTTGLMTGVFDWLWRLHSTTWTNSDPSFVLEVERDLELILSFDKLQSGSARYVTDCVRDVIGIGLTFAFCQGDYNSNNVLIGENGLVSGVVDWEYSGPGPAVFDLFSMLRASLLRPESEAGLLGEQVNALLNGEHPAAPSVLRALSRYAKPEIQESVFLIYVVRLLAGFVRATGDRRDPQLRPWTNYLNSLPTSPRIPRHEPRPLAGVL